MPCPVTILLIFWMSKFFFNKKATHTPHSSIQLDHQNSTIHPKASQIQAAYITKNSSNQNASANKSSLYNQQQPANHKLPIQPAKPAKPAKPS
jgi:hypothetical protein